ncbi:hypothetical protein QT711_14285 [Sporosarcina saromensis]|uniref:Uncharacterized protein n=1 Tax=Sporosarcina saromensis TaxID=359365 RepID=A0ABU4GDB8_9BACL|nr:hypothetical protein [Sporosarcina saromensis]MDW0114362.1 hypothetical protein [Sporosarcina saromensis]
MKELVLFKNELKSTRPSRYKLLGIVSQIILSNELYKKNNDMKDFLKYVFNLEFKDYVMASRTLILARTVRYIEKCSEENYLIYKKRLYKYVDQKIEFKDNEKNIFDGWL